MLVALVLLLGYVFGCVNGAQIIGRLKNINLKHLGSKNAGASNTVHVLGFRYGLLVALIDVLKTVFSLQLVYLLLMNYELTEASLIFLLFLNGLFVIVGHNFPITMNFDGGKGTASFVGVLLFLDWRFALISMLVFILVAIAVDYFVIGTLVMYISFTGYASLNYGLRPALLTLIFLGLFIFKHKENFSRVLTKDEARLSRAFKRGVS